MDTAENLVKAFIAPDRAPRYLALLAKRGGRAQLRAKLAHLRDLDKRFARAVSGSDATPEGLERLLKAAGAPRYCYLLSENSTLDGTELDLRAALDAVVGGGMGTFVSCVPGRLAYFEGEGPQERFVLSRAAV
jgi:hypothetical protein